MGHWTCKELFELRETGLTCASPGTSGGAALGMVPGQGVERGNGELSTWWCTFSSHKTDTHGTSCKPQNCCGGEWGSQTWAAKPDLLLFLFPELLPNVPHASPGHSGPTPAAMCGDMNSCTYLQPHECKTRERALWVSAARARELPEIIPCIAVRPSSLGLGTCCSPLRPAGLGSCRALGQGSPEGEFGVFSVLLPIFIWPWFFSDPIGYRRASAPGQFWLALSEKCLCLQLWEAKGR